MPCTPLPGGGFACSPGRRGSPCQEPGCRELHVALCDWPLTGPAAGKTCDRRMCSAHRHRVGKNRDYCSAHLAMSRRAARP